MPKQFVLNFDVETPKEELKRLQGEYQKAVGVPPHIMLEKDGLLSGIADPEKEKLRLLAISREEDKEEMKKTYRR